MSVYQVTATAGKRFEDLVATGLSRWYSVRRFGSQQEQLVKGDLHILALNGGNPFLGHEANVETKVEEEHTGNLFIEFWSNRSILRTGWLLNLRECEWFLYGFQDQEIIYCLDFHALVEWAVRKQGMHRLDDRGRPNFCRYDWRRQGKHIQANDTWGFLAPVTELKTAGVIHRTCNFQFDEMRTVAFQSALTL